MYLLLFIVTHTMKFYKRFVLKAQELLSDKTRMIDSFTLVLSLMAKFLDDWVKNKTTIILPQFQYDLSVSLLSRVPTHTNMHKAYKRSVLYVFISYCSHEIGTALINIFTGFNIQGALNYLGCLRFSRCRSLKTKKLTLVLNKNDKILKLI